MIRITIGYGDYERQANYRYFTDMANADVAVEEIIERASKQNDRYLDDTVEFDYEYYDVWSIIVDRFKVKHGEYKRVERIARYWYNSETNKYEKEEV